MTFGRRFRIMALLLGWTIFVYFAGPVVAGLERATRFQLSLNHMDEKQRATARWNAAQTLLRDFDSRRPVSVAQSRYRVDDGCGYGRAEAGRTEQDALDYLSGVEALYQGMSHGTARLERFVPALSGFAAVFLDNCIAGTVLARTCANHVDAVLTRAGIRSPYAMPDTASDRDRDRLHAGIVCRYRDGVAARAGRSLSPSPQ